MANPPLDEEAIFHTARKIENLEARAEYLAQICASEPRLRERVEALLRVHEQKEPFLQPVERSAETTTGIPQLELLGKTIGRYKLLQQIGQGGFGVVYMAEQERPIRRKVALKISHPGRDSGQVIARFEAERQALSLMEHPNIARVFDAGATDTGLPYFVMELVRGEPITKYCDDRNLSTRRRLELFLPVCHAIQHAHQKGIIHRDIKPSNILVAEYDENSMAKVIDFGVAKAISQPLTEKTMFTGFGQIVGTLEYMSPEQAKVNQLDIDTRSDIYSLGVVLYELLVGEMPFDRERFRSTAIDEILRIIREEEPPRPSLRLTTSRSLAQTALKRDVDPRKLKLLVRGELDWIVMKCLEKDRARRYETANGLAKDLQRYLDDEPVLARPPTTRYRLAKFARRNKSLVATTLAIMLALTVGLGVATWQAVEATRQRERSEHQLYLADMVRAWDAWKIGNLNEAESLLERHRPRQDHPDRRGVEWSLLESELEVPERVRQYTTSGLPMNLAVTVDGKWIAVSQTDGKVALYSVENDLSDSVTRVSTSLYGLHPLSSDASGSAFAFGGETLDSFRVLDLRSNEMSTCTTEGHVTAVAFGSGAAATWLAVADGEWATRIASDPVRGGDCRISLWNWESVVRGQVWVVDSDAVRQLSWSSDGRLLAAGCEDGRIYVFDVTNGHVVREIDTGNPVHDLCFVVGDSILASVGTSHASHNILLWDIEKGSLRGVLRGHDGLVMGLSRLPNGNLVSCGRDNVIRIWDVLKGVETRRLRGHSHYVSRVAVSSTSNRPLLVSTGHDHQVCLWDLAAEEQVREFRTTTSSQVDELVLSNHGDVIASVSFSSNEVEFFDRRSGKLLYTLSCPAAARGLAIDAKDRVVVGSGDGSVFVYDLRSQQRRELPRRPYSVRACEFSPTGDFLAIAGERLETSFEEVLEVTHVETGRLVVRFSVPDGQVLGVAWSPNGKLLVAGGVHGIRVWATDTWEVLYDLQHGSMLVSDIAFSPNGSVLASCGLDGTVRFWKSQSGLPIGDPLHGHAGFIWEMRFSPDGNTLFTASGDESLGVWDVGTRELRARIPDHIGGSRGLSVSRDGKWLLTGGLWDNKVHVRRLRSELDSQ